MRPFWNNVFAPSINSLTPPSAAPPASAAPQFTPAPTAAPNDAQALWRSAVATPSLFLWSGTASMSGLTRPTEMAGSFRHGQALYSIVATAPPASALRHETDALSLGLLPLPTMTAAADAQQMPRWQTILVAIDARATTDDYTVVRFVALRSARHGPLDERDQLRLILRERQQLGPALPERCNALANVRAYVEPVSLVPPFRQGSLVALTTSELQQEQRGWPRPVHHLASDELEFLIRGRETIPSSFSAWPSPPSQREIMLTTATATSARPEHHRWEVLLPQTSSPQGETSQQRQQRERSGLPALENLARHRAVSISMVPSERPAQMSLPLVRFEGSCPRELTL